MKEICLEMIAHKALILCFNLAQCAQISYYRDEEKERKGDGSYSHKRQVKFGMFLSVSLDRQNIHFPSFGTGSNVQTIFTCAVLLLGH